jgi:transposase-like protein
MERRKFTREFKLEAVKLITLKTKRTARKMYRTRDQAKADCPGSAPVRQK